MSSLSYEQTKAAFLHIMSGQAEPGYIRDFLLSLHTKGETKEELLAGIEVLRAHAIPFEVPEALRDHILDTCGTGGDHHGTYNVSTAVALLCAACDVPVVKHGNRAVSSKSGSADVLKALGVPITEDHDQLQKMLIKYNFCFLMAPLFHPAMKHVAEVRQELKIRTIFNILGPLCNPARPRRQIVGVYSKAWLKPVAEVLQALNVIHALVVHGADGLDEISISDITHVMEVRNGEIHAFTISPEAVGLPRHTIESIKGGDAAVNAAAIERIFAGEASTFADIVAFNAAAALLVAGKATSLEDGLALAKATLKNGKALETLLALKSQK